MRAWLGAAGLIAAAGAALAQPVSESRPMSFEACLATIRGYASETKVAPVAIVETSDLRIVRFPAADGSVLVTCSRPDGRMVLTKSPRS